MHDKLQASWVICIKQEKVLTFSIASKHANLTSLKIILTYKAVLKRFDSCAVVIFIYELWVVCFEADTIGKSDRID
jgi:hypothetical protein